MRKRVAIGILIFAVANWFFSQAFLSMMKDSQLMQADQKLQTLSSTSPLLVVGNSHALAIDSKTLPRAQNVASYGELFHMTFEKTRYLLEEKNIDLDTLIIPLDLKTLQKHALDDQPYQFYWNRYESPSELIHFAENKATFAGTRLSSFLFPYMDGEVDAFDYVFANESAVEKELMRKGTTIVPLNPKAKRSPTDSCAAAQISDLGAFYLQKFLTLAEEHDLTLVFVRYPVSANYYFEHSQCYDPEEFYQKIHSQYFENRNNIHILDYHKLFPDSAFADPHHLKSGRIREIFADTLAHDLDLIR